MRMIGTNWESKVVSEQEYGKPSTPHEFLEQLLMTDLNTIT